MAVRVKDDYISEESTTPEFCDVMDAEPQLLKIVRSDSDFVSSSAVNSLSIPFKGISWPSSSWIDGTRRSAFQPYRPSLCTTVLTNLQRGNTETQTLKQDFSQFTWHQKAGRGDVTSHDIPPDNTVDRVDSQGLTALMWASAYGQHSSVQLLINSGASVNAVGCKNETPLLLATSEGHLDVVRILIANGANVNHTDKKGNTALIYASYNNHHHCVHELLLHGADLMVKNNAGDSAYGLSVRKNNRLVLAVIENYLLSLMDEGEYMAKSS